MQRFAGFADWVALIHREPFGLDRGLWHFDPEQQFQSFDSDPVTDILGTDTLSLPLLPHSVET